MKTIALTRGMFTEVDPEDFDFLMQWKWNAMHSGRGLYYASRGPKKADNTTRRVISMHRVLMHTPSDLVVDHIDRNTLNNSRSNLRNVTPRQNSMNLPPLVGKSSTYKGVFKTSKTSKVWRSAIRINGRLLHLGTFSDELDAANAYAAAARQYFGEFHRTS